jgi:hypothetical protein
MAWSLTRTAKGNLLKISYKMQGYGFITRETWAAWNTIHMISICSGIIGYIITSDYQKYFGNRLTIVRNSSIKRYIFVREVDINTYTNFS